LLEKSHSILPVKKLTVFEEKGQHISMDCQEKRKSSQILFQEEQHDICNNYFFFLKTLFTIKTTTKIAAIESARRAQARKPISTAVRGDVTNISST